MIKVTVQQVPLPRISPIEIQFLNGGVIIPPRYGGYVVASGCGAGKTTAIREIIRQCYHQGILYAAFTIEECNRMYEYCRTFLNENQVTLLHSDYNHEGVEIDTLRNNPDELAKRDVIICTHHKLLNEYPEVFYKYVGNRVYNVSMSHIGRLSMNGKDMKEFSRQLILIDEMPTCDHIKFRVTQNDLRLLGMCDTEQKMMLDPKDGQWKMMTTAKLPLHYTNGGDYRIAEELYRMRAQNAGYYFDNSTKSGKLKNDLALSTIYDNYDALINSDRDEFNLSYTLADQAYSGVDSRIIIFDGTGDLTFVPRSIENVAPDGTKYSMSDYSPFEVLTYPNKYNSPISITKLEMGYKRSYRTTKELHDKLDSIKCNIELKIMDINSIIKSGHKVLVITWKDLKVKDERHGIPVDRGSINEIPYIDYLKFRLNQLGNIDGINYSIIHYQSGLDRATNEFMDYDSVVFLGEFHVPNNVVDEFNRDYSVCTSIDNYTTYQLVQAVCRTRIRNHRGEPINIYFTSDWDNSDINNLNRYLSRNEISEVRDTSLSWIKPKWRKFIDKLCELNPEFRYCIETGKPYKLEFTLDDIYEIYPVSKKEVTRYSQIVKYLKSIGVDLLVIGGHKNRFK